MQPIIPKGYDINQFPPPLNASQRAAADEMKSGSSKSSTIEGNKKLALGILNQYKGFFIPHFGTNMLSGLMTMYFPAGHQVKEGGGAGNALSIAQEIMEYKNPSPTEVGLTLGQVIALLHAILQMPKIESGTTYSQTAAADSIKSSVFTLDVRPTRDAIVAIRQVPSGAKVGSTGKAVLIGNQKLSKYINTNLFKLSDYEYSRPLGDLLKSFTIQKSHSEGFDALPETILDYYQDAYKGTPRQFWETNSKHRLGVEVDPAFGKGYYTVKVFPVDPVTGAPRRFGAKAVARALISSYPQNSGFLISKVKRSLFPEMYLLSEGVVAGTKQREEHYKDQLLRAKNLFQGIPNKANTPIACVVDRSYSYAYPGQGKPLPTSSGPLTTTPINGLRIYLQPTGIEEAMRRILDVSHPKGNAIEKWFVNDLTGAKQYAETGTKYKYTQSYTDAQWNAILSRYIYTVKGVYALLDNPNLIREGLNGATFASTQNSPSGASTKMAMWGANHWLTSVPTSVYSQYLIDIMKIFNYAGWPQAVPQEIFSAPVDDHKDVGVVLGVFNNYMKTNADYFPGQMYAAESFNGTISSKVYVTPSNAQGTGQGGIPQKMFVFDKRLSILYPKKKVLENIGNKSTLKLQTYSVNARTVVTKRQLSTTSLINMPKIQSSYSTVGASVPLSDVKLGMGVGAGAVALAVAIMGYSHLKR